MSEDSNYQSGAWSGHDYQEARKAYQEKASRSYSQATSAGVTASSLIPLKLRTESTCPLVVMVDVTGSMGTWPETLFSKLPYLDLEGKEYLGPDLEISFAANTDLHDKYPFQAKPFKSGIDLKAQLDFVTGGGAGPLIHHEAYELGVLYYARNVEMPNAVKPIFIFIADEMPHALIEASTARQIHVTLNQRMSVDEVFAELKAKYSVYLVHKAYPSAPSRQEWVRLLGEERIADLDDPNRVVDVIFGLLAKECGRVPYFRSEIEGRQKPEQVKVVYEALKTVHRGIVLHEPAKKGQSRMHVQSTGKKSGDLL